MSADIRRLNYKEGPYKAKVENYKKWVQDSELTVKLAVEELGINRRMWYNLKSA